MNVVITLPKQLIIAIIEGTKTFEMRKCRPKHMKVGVDGFFVVEKGTKRIHCWCRVDEIQTVSGLFSLTKETCKMLAVSKEYVDTYRSNAKFIYLWRIGKVNRFEDGAVTLEDLVVDRAPVWIDIFLSLFRLTSQTEWARNSVPMLRRNTIIW